MLIHNGTKTQNLSFVTSKTGPNLLKNEVTSLNRALKPYSNVGWKFG